MQKLDPLHHALMNKLAELKDGNHSPEMAEDSPDDPNHSDEPDETDAAPSLPGHLQASQAQHGNETGEDPGAVHAIAGMGAGNPFHAKAAAMAKEKMATIEKSKKAKGI